MPQAATQPMIQPAIAIDEAAIHALLADVGLPSEEFSRHRPHFFVARRVDCVVGCVGLEPLGVWGVMRSLVVARPERGRGLATALCRRLMEHARGQGIARLYLVTAAARPLFEQLGFHAVDRTEVPAAVRATEELTTFRDSTAVCMTRALA